jgi:hypothetical protein
MGRVVSDLITVPSGQRVTLLQVLSDTAGPMGLTLRFRFLAPGVAREGGEVDPETAAKDMDALCQDYALPRVSNMGPQPAQIVISMSDVDVPFGETQPEATQLFNSYSIEDGICVWDMF